MKNTCASVNWFLRAGCRFVAWTYYSWMRNWGEKSYKAPSLGFCNENWVPACV
ncbi:hypothetical protein DPMN_148136 [Dreissena polymorpha]|uniref:Uncharacterized protein n=1 Tax=Dreissena polymorpha TaxID=45954 RepID=A0A9D4J3K6_DREPO|nr:hypothetical protein DPMN_148136 [Dreissena polymorpha]